MTKSSMLAWSNAIVPWTRSSNVVRPVGHEEADGARLARPLRARAISSAVSDATGAVVDPRPAGGLRGVALGFQVLGLAVAVVGVAGRDQPHAPRRGTRSSRSV